MGAALCVGGIPVSGAHAERSPRLPSPPHLLPGDAAAARVPQSGTHWIVGARPGGDVARVARDFNARLLMAETGVYSVPRSSARDFSIALRKVGRLVFSEPDARTRRKAFPSDPLTPYQGWLRQIVRSDLTPPAVSGQSASLGIVESGIDRNHPELSGGNVFLRDGTAPVDGHGTAVTAIAAAPANGQGIVGVWPGMRALISASTPTCGGAVDAIDYLVRARVSVINMSYGIPGGCFAHYLATSRAFGAGVLPVAAAGNEFENGNPVETPAADPHVLTVAATAPDLSTAYFSNENAAIDLAAPGVGVLTAVPPEEDADGPRDGYARMTGTSFSAPMVAAAATWVAEARPRLDNTQVFEVMRDSATDLGRPGYDISTGFGLLNVARALRVRARRRDPLEPNDDIGFVDGSFFSRADPPIFGRRSRRRTVRARIDVFEDPADVYRIVVPARRAVRIVIKPRFGDPNLTIFGRRATSAFGRRDRIARSRRRGRRSEIVEIINKAARSQVGFVVVSVSRQARSLDSEYRLVLRRLRR